MKLTLNSLFIVNLNIRIIYIEEIYSYIKEPKLGLKMGKSSMINVGMVIGEESRDDNIFSGYQSK